MAHAAPVPYWVRAMRGQLARTTAKVARSGGVDAQKGVAQVTSLWSQHE